MRGRKLCRKSRPSPPALSVERGEGDEARAEGGSLQTRAYLLNV